MVEYNLQDVCGKQSKLKKKVNIVLFKVKTFMT